MIDTRNDMTDEQLAGVVADIERRVTALEAGRLADNAGPWLTMSEAARRCGLSIQSLRQRMTRSHGPLRWDVVRFPDGSPVPSGDRVIRESDLSAEMAKHLREMTLDDLRAVATDPDALNLLCYQLMRRDSPMPAEEAVAACAEWQTAVVDLTDACTPRPPKAEWFGTGPGQWDAWWVEGCGVLRRTVLIDGVIHGWDERGEFRTPIMGGTSRRVLPVSREGYPAPVGWGVVGL